MSRDLNFWKYKEKISLKNNEVYAKLSDGKYIEGIQELPISNIIKSIDHVLSSWNKLDEAHYRMVKKWLNYLQQLSLFDLIVTR